MLNISGTMDFTISVHSRNSNNKTTFTWAKHCAKPLSGKRGY